MTQAGAQLLQENQRSAKAGGHCRAGASVQSRGPGYRAARPLAQSGQPAAPVRLSPALHLATGGRQAIRRQPRDARMPSGDPRHLDLGRAGCPRAHHAHQGARKPRMIVSDNGTEFASNAVLRWSKEYQVEWHYIAPGKPMQNGHIEILHRPPARRISQREPVP